MPVRSGFRESIALGERGDLVGVDAVNQPVEMLRIRASVRAP